MSAARRRSSRERTRLPREDELHAWFAAQGWTPFAYQRETWEAYLAGGSGLVHAPTGVGKTLAVWLGPLIEWLRETDGDNGAAVPVAKDPPIRVLWLTPLRALANDTLASLQQPVAALRIPWRLELRTGDTNAKVRRLQRERLPTALVTTPESLTLQLSYEQARERMATLRCIIVDEWHELIGTKRGVQTELALARLRRWLPALRVWGLSATLGNLDEAMRVLMRADGRESRPARLIHGDLPKELQIETIVPQTIERFPWAGHLGVKLRDAVIAAIEKSRSTLLFANTRSQAEIWFRVLLEARPDWTGQIAIHHGSLDRALRTQVETMIAAGLLRCVVCTASLDLGVDFSPVDQVIQLGSPKGIARLVQRAGRSGHQPGATSRVLCVPTHAFELVEFAAARSAVAARKIEARPPLERPLDVLAQHLVTVAIGGGFREDELFDEVRTTHAFRNLSAQEWSWVLDFAVRGGPSLKAYPDYARITRDDDGVFRGASPRIARMHRMSIGTISSDTSLTVKYVGGRGSLGSIEEAFIARLKPGDTFVFAGRALELVRVHQMTVHVRRASKSAGVVPRWNGGRFPLSTQLGAAVREKLAAARQGHYGSEAEMAAVRPLLELQKAQSLLPGPGEVLAESVLTRDGFHQFLYPFEGRLVHEGLAVLLAFRLSRETPRSVHISANDYGVELLSPTELDLSESDWRRLLSNERLTEDLVACVNVGELARRQFRDIARVAGLVFSGYPGERRAARHLQASSELFFDVFSEFDAENLLLAQARREVLEQQLEVARLRATLQRIASQRIVLVRTERLSPLAFPLWAERMRAQEVSSEKWSQRVQRMSLLLEKQAATAGKGKPKRAETRVGG